MKQEPLGKYIGSWVLSKDGKEKHWRVLASDEIGFIIVWGDTDNEVWDITNPKKIVIGESSETYNRILSKARQGYVLVRPITETAWTPMCHDEFDSIEESVQLAEREFRKRKPRLVKRSILDWLDGVSETRPDENI